MALKAVLFPRRVSVRWAMCFAEPAAMKSVVLINQVDWFYRIALGSTALLHG